MKNNNLIKVLKFIILILFSLNIIYFVYNIVLMIEYNFIVIFLFLTFLLLSIVNIFYVKRRYEISENMCRKALDLMFENDKNINELLLKKEIDKIEANKQKEGCQEYCNFRGNICSFFDIILKISIIILFIPISLLLIQLSINESSLFKNYNIRIYVFILGIISQILIFIFSLIVYNMEYNDKCPTSHNKR